MCFVSCGLYAMGSGYSPKATASSDIVGGEKGW